MGMLLRVFTKWLVSLALMLFLVGAVPSTMEDALRAYMNGDCVRAAQLWGLKAEQGNAEARYRLGRMFAEGVCAKGRQDDGIRLIASAASQGYAAAQTEMGVRYLLGDGVPVNYDAAVDWLGRARVNPDSAIGTPVDVAGGPRINVGGEGNPRAIDDGQHLTGGGGTGTGGGGGTDGGGGGIGIGNNPCGDP